MSDGTAADVQLHPTKIANKRRKIAKSNAANGAVRKDRPPARIFVPFRACLSTILCPSKHLYADNTLLRL